MLPQIEHWFLSKIIISFCGLHLFRVCISSAWEFSSQFAFAYSKYIVSCMDMHKNSWFAGGNEVLLISWNNEKNEESQRSWYSCVKCLVNKTKRRNSSICNKAVYCPQVMKCFLDWETSLPNVSWRALLWHKLKSRKIHIVTDILICHGLCLQSDWTVSSTVKYTSTPAS